MCTTWIGTDATTDTCEVRVAILAVVRHQSDWYDEGMSMEMVDLATARTKRPLHKTVAANVRAEAARMNVTQAQIAEVIGKTQQVVSSKMRGQTPFQLDELAVVAPLMSMTVAELITGERGQQSAGDDGWAPWESNPQPAD